MACPSDVTTGFVTIQGPIQQSDLNGITVKTQPLTTAFSPRTSEPTLFNKNYIDDTQGSTCLYKATRYNLSDIQLVAPIHTGFTLPGQKQTPKAELVLSFSANASAGFAGILLCVPIYDSGATHHDAYLNQLIDTSAAPICKHTRNPGQDYTTKSTTKANRTLTNTTLQSCIREACNDSKCVAYTFKSKTGYLYYEIPSVTNVADQTVISGTIDHTASVNSCSTQNATNTPPVLESVFKDQPSFSYKTCFETVDSTTKELESHGLYVLFFPNGVTMGSSNYQQLILQLGGNLPRYRCPVSIRGPDPTLLTYEFDSGSKTALTTSDGFLYTSPLSSCTDEFRNRIEFFASAPKTTASSVGTSATSSLSQCKYNTKQYKCVPLDKLSTLNEGDIASGKPLDQCITAQYPTSPIAPDSSYSIEQMETIAGAAGSVIVLIGIVLAINHWRSK